MGLSPFERPVRHRQNEGGRWAAGSERGLLDAAEDDLEPLPLGGCEARRPAADGGDAAQAAEGVAGHEGVWIDECRRPRGKLGLEESVLQAHGQGDRVPVAVQSDSDSSQAG
jgi:hypothetical protein